MGVAGTTFASVLWRGVGEVEEPLATEAVEFSNFAPGVHHASGYIRACPRRAYMPREKLRKESAAGDVFVAGFVLEA